MTIIFLTRSLPSPIADELACQGLTVRQALAISEVLALVEQHPQAHIVIATDVEPKQAKEIQRRYPTLALKPGATVQDVIWELSLLAQGTIQ